MNKEESISLLKTLYQNPLAAIIFLAKAAFHALISIDAQITSILRSRLVIALGENVSEALRQHGIPHYIPQKPHISSIIALLKELI